MESLHVWLLFSLCLKPSISQNFQCSSSDESFWRTGGVFFEFEDNLQSCYLVTTKTNLNTEPCFRNAIPDFSSACNSCAVDLAQCASNKCLNVCGVCSISRNCEDPEETRCVPSCSFAPNADDFFSQECELCRQDNCNTNFETCSGLSLSICNGCTQPSDVNESLPVILGVTLSLSVVLIVGLGFLYNDGKLNRDYLFGKRKRVESVESIDIDGIRRSGYTPPVKKAENEDDDDQSIDLNAHRAMKKLANSKKPMHPRPDSFADLLTIPQMGPQLPSMNFNYTLGRFRVLHTFEAEQEEELSCKEGEIITGNQEVDKNWILCTNEEGSIGIVPLNHLERIDEPNPETDFEDIEVGGDKRNTNTGMTDLDQHTGFSPVARPQKNTQRTKKSPIKEKPPVTDFDEIEGLVDDKENYLRSGLMTPVSRTPQQVNNTKRTPQKNTQRTRRSPVKEKKPETDFDEIEGLVKEDEDDLNSKLSV